MDVGQIFEISRNTTVVTTHPEEPILKNAASILQRDINKVVTYPGLINEIYLVIKHDTNEKDSNSFVVKYLNEKRVEVISSTQLGVMYGVLSVSREILGIDDFWYFMDTPIDKRKKICWNNFNQHLPDYKTEYRGWFVNDELLLTGWKDHISSEYVWDRVYETLLRLGGNIIIPGTDKESKQHRQGAQSMGLIIAHHHAEPLGAEMFARAYPNLEASYLKYPELFKKMWRDSIISQRGTSVLYGLGFRGQGDRPFWLEDKTHKWSEKEKAEVINKVILMQYDMVRELDPKASCAINIYGELTALFNAGLLNIPNDVIEIWADSGYGKMVSRRQGDDNPRSPILDIPNKDNRKRGIYYHVTFHDLQASNFLTLLPNGPQFVSNELMKVRDVNMDTLELINVGNIKPHILFIREIAKSWYRNYKSRSNEDIINDYVKHYYDEKQSKIVKIYESYFKSSIQYGTHEDEKAGDEFATYTLRKIIKAWMGRYSQLEEMNWLTGDVPINKQLELINKIVNTKSMSWETLRRQSIQVYEDIIDSRNRTRFYNDMLIGITVQSYSLQALEAVIRAINQYKNGEIIHAFLGVNEAIMANDKILKIRQDNPSPKWFDFFDNDAYSNIKLNAIRLRRLRSYLRVLGDGPDEDEWERKYLMENCDSRVMLLSNTHLALSDDQIARKLKEQLIDEG